MTQVIQIAHNAVNAQVVNASREIKLLVQEALTYRVEGAEHMGAFKAGSWDGRSSFFTFSNAVFPRGFLALVQHRLQKAGHRVHVVKDPFPTPLGPERPVVDTFGEDPRYEYQHEVYQKLIKHGQVIARVATGGGKSRIAKLATERISRPTLFLTTRSVLMHQMAKNFESMNKKVALFGDDIFQQSNEITCGMVQSISSWLEPANLQAEIDFMVGAIVRKEEKEVTKLKDRLKKDKVPMLEIAKQVDALTKQLEAKRPSDAEFKAKAQVKYDKQLKRNAYIKKMLEKFEFVILEEAHEVSGEGFYNVMRACKNAHYRLALTGTPFMKDSQEDNMRLMAVSGHVAVVVTEKQLIDLGILAKPYFKYVDLPTRPPKLFKSTPFQAAYQVGIVNNEYRNKAIVYEVLRAKKYGLRGMILCLHTEHGKILSELLKKYGVRAEYIRGENDQKERARALQMLADGEIDVLLGTNILDVGVDVPAVAYVILAGAGKAEVAVRQRIGRGLRAKKLGPNVTFVIDFRDAHNNHLRSHYLARELIVKSTPGFVEGIVNDFDYEGLGFTVKLAA